MEPVRRDGHVVRGWWRLVVEWPGEGRTRRTRKVEASGKKCAAELLDAWLPELERELNIGDQPITVRELSERWIRVRTDGEKPWRPKTRKFYDDNLRLHILPTLGDVPADQVRSADLSLLYASLGLEETSRHHVHATIRALFNWGVRNELLLRNPALLVDHPPQQVSKPGAVWSEETVSVALRAAAGLGRKQPTPQLVHIPIVLGAWAGLRCGEMCALRWEHVDLEAGTIAVVEGISQTAKGELHYHGPKRAERTVPIPKQAVALLRSHKARQDELRIARRRRWNVNGYVLCRQTGEPVKPSNLSSAWSRFCTTHKLPEIRLHDLRHSFATSIFEQGGEQMLKVVQELLGHADPAITARIYLHATPHVLEAVTAAQEKRIAAAERFAAKRALTGHSGGLD